MIDRALYLVALISDHFATVTMFGTALWFMFGPKAGEPADFTQIGALWLAMAAHSAWVTRETRSE